MTEFACKTIISMKQLAIQDKPETDSPAQVYHHRTFLVPRPAETQLGQRYHARIVFYKCREPDLLTDMIGNARFAASQERIIQSFLCIHKTRHPDPYSYDLLPFNSRTPDMVFQLLGQGLQRIEAFC